MWKDYVTAQSSSTISWDRRTSHMHRNICMIPPKYTNRTQKMSTRTKRASAEANIASACLSTSAFVVAPRGHCSCLRPLTASHCLSVFLSVQDVLKWRTKFFKLLGYYNLGKYYSAAAVTTVKYSVFIVWRAWETATGCSSSPST